MISTRRSVDPQAQHLGLEITAEHPIQGKVRTIRPAIGFDGFRETSFTPPPVLGEHNDTIRREIANLGPEADAASSQPLAHRRSGKAVPARHTLRRHRETSMNKIIITLAHCS